MRGRDAVRGCCVCVRACSVDPADEEVASRFVHWIRQVLRSREEYDAESGGDEDSASRRMSLVESKSLISTAVSALKVCRVLPPIRRCRFRRVWLQRASLAVLCARSRLWCRTSTCVPCSRRATSLKGVQPCA
jgi:hypothetical protein